MADRALVTGGAGEGRDEGRGALGIGTAMQVSPVGIMSALSASTLIPFGMVNRPLSPISTTDMSRKGAPTRLAPVGKTRGPPTGQRKPTMRTTPAPSVARGRKA